MTVVALQANRGLALPQTTPSARGCTSQLRRAFVAYFARRTFHTSAVMFSGNRTVRIDAQYRASVRAPATVLSVVFWQHRTHAYLGSGVL